MSLMKPSAVGCPQRCSTGLLKFRLQRVIERQSDRFGGPPRPSLTYSKKCRDLAGVLTADRHAANVSITTRSVNQLSERLNPVGCSGFWFGEVSCATSLTGLPVFLISFPLGELVRVRRLVASSSPPTQLSASFSRVSVWWCGSRFAPNLDYLHKGTMGNGCVPGWHWCKIGIELICGHTCDFNVISVSLDDAVVLKADFVCHVSVSS